MEWDDEVMKAYSELRRHVGSACYGAMLGYLEALYEQEKQRMVQCHDAEGLPLHWLRSRGLKQLLEELGPGGEK